LEVLSKVYFSPCQYNMIPNLLMAEVDLIDFLRDYLSYKNYT